MTPDEERLEKKIDHLTEIVEGILSKCPACQLQVAINTQRISENGDIGKDLACHYRNIKDLNKWQWITTGGLAVLTFLLPISIAAIALMQKVK